MSHQQWRCISFTLGRSFCIDSHARHLGNRSWIISKSGHIFKVSRCYSTQVGFDHKFDVVVVGSGAAGLTAAFTAAVKGNHKVLVVEKTQYFGGTTAFSGGGLWIPNNPKMQSLGLSDSRDQSESYIRECLDGFDCDDMISAFLDSGPEMVKWMEKNSAVRFVGIPAPDYHMDLKGANFGRTIMTAPYDGRRLGSLVQKVRYPLQGMCAFRSMQTDLSEINTWKTPFASWRNFAFCARSLSRYGIDKLRYGKGTALYNGNALIGRLLESAKGAGVELWNNTGALQPILSDNQVTGLILCRDGKTIRLQARKGVVLASGGFSRSSELSRKYLPNSDWTAAARGSQGDGLRIGIAAGGNLPLSTQDKALWAPISQFQPAKGPIRYFPHLALDRSKPGCIIVDGDGKRFANESAPYQPFGHATHTAGIRKEYLIGDSVFLRRYGMGVALPSPYPIWHILRRGYLLQASTIPDLARRIGIEPNNLVATIDRFNNFARQGKDLDFHRGEAIYDQAYGDPSVTPNSSLAPITSPPFYALPMYPGNVATLYGLVTNINSQVLNQSHKPIPGLFAVGSDQNSVMKGKYPGGGSTLGPGMAFGYRAGTYLAQV